MSLTNNPIFHLLRSNYAFSHINNDTVDKLHALVSERHQVASWAKKPSNVWKVQLFLETDPIMAPAHRAILAIGGSYVEDANFMGILDGNNDLPRIIRRYPIYSEIHRRIFL